MPANRLLFAFCILYLGLQSVLGSGFNFLQLSALAKSRYGQQAYDAIVELNELTKTFKNANDETKLKVVNDFFNQKLEYGEDIFIWKQSDYWATPLESIGAGAADCEDFSIAKYAFLRILGINNSQLRLTYVRAQLSNDGITSIRAHMVLSYFKTPQSSPLILDNLIPQIKPASERPDLYPVYSFNDQSLWVGKEQQPKSNAQNHLSKWRDVLSRMHEDGIE
jgi:predicted transglutaminase-like cysteine proteinase